MKNLLLILLLLGLLAFGQNSTSNLIKNSAFISQPVHIGHEGLDFTGTENIIMVPENRAEPDSRKIGLHFFHFPAKEKSNLPPIVFLPAGPGEPYDVDRFYAYYHGKRAEAWTWELEFVNQKRDLILINQRGNPDAPGLPVRDFEYRWQNGVLEKPFDLLERNSNRKTALKKAVAAYTHSGMDLRGYDILNFVEDIETIRTFYSYEKLAFIGTSFGSQWALAYMQKHPNSVDRAILAGVEPLDHTYDDPEGIWDVLAKIDSLAKTDNKIAQDLPEVGLLEAFKTILSRLETAPQAVKLELPEKGIEETVLLGPDDFRFAYLNPFAEGQREAIESWPKYISELYNGDYRALALRSRGRASHSSSLVMAALVDNSLGISSEREAALDSKDAKHWLGDINLYYKETRKVCPSPVVPNSFRQQGPTNIPIILIQGNMDRSTPYENALYLRKYLSNGHLITVDGGTHAAKRALILGDPILAEHIYSFMNMDFNKTDFQTFKKKLPQTYADEPFEFWPIQSESLFNKYTRKEQ